ncbi:hypothetical protein ACI65C_013456 [Semiaphis heraclei]
MTSRGRVNKLLSLCNLKTSIEIPISQANIEENKITKVSNNTNNNNYSTLHNDQYSTTDQNNIDKLLLEINGDTFICFDYDIEFEPNSIFETVQNIVTQPSQIESDTFVENFVMEQTDQAQYEYLEIGSINPNQCFEYDNLEQENQIQNDNKRKLRLKLKTLIVEHINPISLEEEAEIETEEPHILLPKRKRSKNPEKWKRNIKKLAKNRGEEYKSASGLIVKAKSLKPPCENCRYKCSSILNLEIRNKIKAKFWEMGDKVRQREFIVRHVVPVLPKYKMKTPNSNRKLSNMAYFLEEEEVGKVRVCKKMFESTLVISDKIIRNCFNKLNTAGILEPLNHGKHDNHKRISEEMKKDVLDHIDSFPPYSRPPGITDVKKKDLMQLCDANVIPNCHKQFYENINVCQRTESDDE